MDRHVLPFACFVAELAAKMADIEAIFCSRDEQGPRVRAKARVGWRGRNSGPVGGGRSIGGARLQSAGGSFRMICSRQLIERMNEGGKKGWRKIQSSR